MYRLKLLKFLAQQAVKSGKPQKANTLLNIKQYPHLLNCKFRENAQTEVLTSNTRLFSHAANIPQEKTEQEFLVRLKNDPDTFGDPEEREEIYEKDLEEEKDWSEKTIPLKRQSTKQYADMIKALIKQHKIKEAIDVVEVKMIKEDKVKPENYIYNLLIGACGRVGYTKKAFSVYNQMKKRGLKITAGTYTALFNACANSPWPEDGLTRARKLQNIMIEKMYEPNDTNYHAMIKAFGRCGDLPAAFKLVDEMAAKKVKITGDTMNFLLQACIQDREAGFRHALLLWRKMVDKRIAPNLYTYNLILRCVRDCGLGNLEVTNETLQIILKKNLRLSGGDNKLLLEGSNDGKCLIQSNELVGEVDHCRPNLMARVPHLGNIISLSEITKPEDRLLLVGGLRGFLGNMTESGCTPDIKSFTQLLDCLPGSEAAEKELLREMKRLGVKPDIDFFNMLIKKRSMRFDYESAKAVLNDMKKYNYRPNLITYGVLSLGCKTKEEALELLKEMEAHSYRLNTEILGAMLHQACYHKNFPYVLEIMEISLRENVKPNKKFMECLHDFKKKCKDISNDKENTLSQSGFFQKGFRIFQMRYKTWLDEVEVDDSEDVHPWAQFRQTSDTDSRHYKDKSQRFKARHLSRFKVKTSTKRKGNER
ncbi:pentatricopeptide repeat-containing protein 1, mitochondrial [Tribolium castaneum]|uniref:Pentatricopeptide repeat-containing protein 1, mitochondrial-like Protein n=1 Tax=Tribolium castaneum TaxID=7070 RepID=D6WG40_TRICA|nr:PREDICTED: pentatricopeptide repeat-containing protein 1, mitochondrial [Tribolium castaneum]EFA00524.1 Pentatricopeptide repeat-containing protein 1, mitochondrial-like Protein [Tribolium castaneum]|eukprot:XP_971079.1 PREDICTED: pentatricopeptide repeat-containing protein 1, mitochondrial [Tribolium castaneum]